MDPIIMAAAILTTIMDSESAPSGILYAGLMSRGASFDDYTSVLGALKEAGFVTESNNVLTLTAEGLAKAKEIDALV